MVIDLATSLHARKRDFLGLIFAEPLHAGWSPVRWSSNGNEIFVFKPNTDHASANVVRVNIQTGEQNPWLSLHPADTVGVYMLAWLDVTPDGRSYAYTFQQDLCDLYILDGLI